MKRAAVIGLGDISSIHIMCIQNNPEITLAAVCDIEENKRDQAPEGVPFYTSYQDMIYREKPDVVHICLPHYLHVPVSIAAAEMGYHCVEISQIPMTPENVSDIKKACEEYGIKVAACSASLEPMMPGMPGEYLTTDFDKIVADCKALNCDLLRIGMLPVNCMGSRDKALDFVKRADDYAGKLKEHGIDLYYHNHHIEFIKYDGQYLLDIIKDNTRYMGFELDIHWIQRGGENPVEFIKKYAGRIRLIHLKDYRIREVRLPEGAFDRTTFMQAFTDTIEFAELGEGSLPVKECVEAGFKGGSEYFLIEQDETYDRDPFESLRISRDHLIELGYKDWFEL